MEDIFDQALTQPENLVTDNSLDQALTNLPSPDNGVILAYKPN